MRLPSFLALALTLALGGCAGYRVGPTGGQVAGAKSVQITPFINRSPEPGLADELTSALRKSIQRDGTFQLATDGQADLIVTGVLTDYTRRELSLLTTDLRTVSDYQINVKAQVTVRERASGKILHDRVITGTTLLRVGQDFVSSERQAAPLLAQDVAQQITDLLADGGW